MELWRGRKKKKKKIQIDLFKRAQNQYAKLWDQGVEEEGKNKIKLIKGKEGLGISMLIMGLKN